MKNIHKHKAFIPGVGVAIVAIVIVGALALHKGDPAGNAESALSGKTLAQATSTQATTTPSAIEKYIASGQETICTFHIKDPGTESSGTFYIKGKNIRGDFETTNTAMKKSIKSSAIIGVDGSYAWTDLSSVGYRLPVKADENLGAQIQGMLSMSRNGATASYDCKPGKVDASHFELPKTVKFGQ